MARERIELRICRSLKSVTSHKMNSALVSVFNALDPAIKTKLT